MTVAGADLCREQRNDLHEDAEGDPDGSGPDPAIHVDGHEVVGE